MRGNSVWVRMQLKEGFLCGEVSRFACAEIVGLEKIGILRLN